MKVVHAIQNAYREMGDSIRRFPLTVAFLIIFTFVNARAIEGSGDEYLRLMFTVLMGSLLSAAGQLIYERFYSGQNARLLLMGISIGLTVAYYFLLGAQEEIEMSQYIRTIVVLFALFIAFIWIPTIKNEQIAFHESFLSVFKAVVATLVYAGVLTIGIVLIFQAIYFLLFELDEDLLYHLLNPVGSLFAPLYFLSQTLSVNESHPQVHFDVPPILDRLLSYIIIPLVIIYTIILILYILINIGGRFWMDNLLEPLFVSYTLIGIIVLILSNNLNNRISTIFQAVFPKVFVPIAIFQTLSSILKIGDMGITHGRYYVILFGLFAIAAGILFSLNRPRYYGWLAVVLLVLAAISVVPPVDAFSVSKRNQIHLFEEKLEETGLLENQTIVPNAEVSTADRIILTNSMLYLSEMGYTDDLAYLPENFEVYNDFDKTFGFELTFEDAPTAENAGRFAYVENEYQVVQDIEEADLFVRQYVHISSGENSQPAVEIPFTHNSESYTMIREVRDGAIEIEILDSDENTLISVNATDLFGTIFQEANGNSYITIDENLDNATFIEENNQAALRLSLMSLEETADYYSADYYLFIDIK